MKISRREKHLIWIAGAVASGICYYSFVYVNQAAALADKRENLTSLQEQYDTNMDLINSLSTRTSRMEETYNTLISRRDGYYTDIVQEKLIVTLEDLIKASGLTADISFDSLSVNNIEVLSAEGEQLLKDTLEQESDKYNGVASSENKSDTNNNDGNSSNKSDKKSSSNSKQVTEEVVKQLKVTLKYNGSYESLKLFLNLAEANTRKIIVSNLNFTAKSETEISGEMTIEFYSLSSLNKEDIIDSNWTINNIYGKNRFVSKGAATGAYKNENKSDFSLVLRATGSELPTISLGQTSDKEKISSITSTKTSIENITVEFNEENGKIYYKYTVGNETFPKDNSQLGMAFTPNSDDIIFDILSTERIGTSDNSGVSLKVINNTVKNVSVVVENDDTTKPRVNTTSEGKVTVTKK